MVNIDPFTPGGGKLVFPQLTYTASAIARILRVSDQCVLYWCYRGRLDVNRRERVYLAYHRESRGRSVYIQGETLIQFIEKISNLPTFS